MSKKDINPKHDYGVFFVGGSVGEIEEGLQKWFQGQCGVLKHTFINNLRARQYAFNQRQHITKGEKHHYGMTYLTAKLTKSDKKFIENDIIL